jgi:SAM-dependent methyltransferase/DNA-binding phage protein
MPPRLTEEQARLAAKLVGDAKTAAGLTDGQIADKAGYVEETIREVLNGRCRTLETVSQVCSALKIDLDSALNEAKLVRFPPPRIASDTQAQAVRGALEAFLARDEDRFRRLFLAEEPLVPSRAERPWMEILAAAGYVKATLAGALRPCVGVYFLDELFIATDLLARHYEDQVCPLTFEQAFLVRSMDIRKGDHVLELCLGSGVNALAAARRGATRVVGVDISERALAFAATNAAVNLTRQRGGAPLETLRGNLLEPLAAEDRFDLILVNPPFEPVPPGTRYFLHSHGGEDGLDIVRALLPAVPQRLRPGGRFEMYTWTPSDPTSEWVTDLVLAAFPGFRVEVRRVTWVSREACFAKFRDRPGFAEWRDRLIARGVTQVWGIHVRAVRDGPAGRVQIDAADDVRACGATLSRWRGK